MANFDLEEQEQLDQLKHFWAQYGNLITWTLIVVLGGFAAWNGWNWWQRSQSIKAAALYDEIERGAQARDAAKTERALADIKDQFGRTSFAAQGALLGGPEPFRGWQGRQCQGCPELGGRQCFRRFLSGGGPFAAGRCASGSQGLR